MVSNATIDKQFNQADVNHDGGIDQREFRQFVNSGHPHTGAPSTTYDAPRRPSAGGTTVSYPIGLDVAVAGFTAHPETFERFASAASATEKHGYGVGPDVAVGAPNHPKEVSQYDPAGAMFNYADVNHDGRIDRTEFGTFMHTI